VELYQLLNDVIVWPTIRVVWVMQIGFVQRIHFRPGRQPKIGEMAMEVDQIVSHQKSMKSMKKGMTPRFTREFDAHFSRLKSRCKNGQEASQQPYL
jgi:hypothetical protein